MTRRISLQLDTALDNPTTNRNWILKLEHPEGTLRLWGGIGQLEYLQEIYEGSGILLDVSSIELTKELEVQRAVFTLARVEFPPELEALVLTPANRVPLALHTVFLNDELQVIDRAFLYFQGFADAPVVTRDPSQGRTYTVTAEGKIYNLVKPTALLMSEQEQKARYPLDIGYDDAKKYETPEARWAPGAYNNFMPPT